MNLREQLERRLAVGRGSPARRPEAAMHALRLALALALAVLTYLLFPASPAADVPLYQVGAVAGDNVISPFAFTVQKTDDELAQERAELEAAAPPIFAYVPAARDSAQRELAAFGGALDQAALATPDARLVPGALQRAAAPFGVALTTDEALYLAQPSRRAALLTGVARVFERWLTAGVASSGALDSVRGVLVVRRDGAERRALADSVTTFTMLVGRARLLHPDAGSGVADRLYLRLLTRFFHPTIVPDRAATQLRRDELRRSVNETKYQVRAGEKIVGANEVVGREEHEKLRALHDRLELGRRHGSGGGRVVGAILFNFLLVSLLGMALYAFRRQVYRSLRLLALFAGVYALVLVGAAVVAHLEPVRPELVPIALAAIVISALFDQRISMIAAFVLAALIGAQSPFRGTNALFASVIVGPVAALSVRAIRRRNQSYVWMFAVAGAYVAAAVAIGLTLALPWRDIVTSSAWGALNALISVLLALLLLPIAEYLTGIETDLTLLEWSDLNRPLLQQLSLEAPGTFAHTIAIANLAEAACRAIGANALLARVGAYYHDIGKLAKPQYFVENQARGRNPHDKLKPSTSAAIIRNHVREGLELAAAHKLPRALQAFITEHHGTGAIGYFMEKARERDGTVANPADYAYPGPVPQSAETAVVMLADGVEAATRALQDPTPARIREVIDHIVRQRMEQGQLRDAPLTLRQLSLIKDEFARVLVGMHHGRIDYPVGAGGVPPEPATA